MITIIYALVLCIGSHCQPAPTLYQTEDVCKADAAFMNSKIDSVAAHCEPRGLASNSVQDPPEEK